MSEEEKRRIRAEALLEFEEAKAQLALLRAKAAGWQRLYAEVVSLLGVAAREFGHQETSAIQKRAEVERDAAALREVLGVDGVLALDTEIAGALARLKRAAQTKKDLGFD